MGRSISKVNILGFPVSRLSMEDTVAYLAEKVEEGRSGPDGGAGDPGIQDLAAGPDAGRISEGAGSGETAVGGERTARGEKAAAGEAAAGEIGAAGEALGQGAGRAAQRIGCLPLRVVTANAEILYAASRNAAQAELLHSAHLITADGVGTVKAARQLGSPGVERVTGVDLLWRLCAEAARRGWGVYLLGAAEESVAGTAERLKREWPQLRLLGWHNGYFDKEEEKKILEEISGLKPELLFVALGFPRQDLFVEENRQRLGAGLCMGVGGSFDVLSGRVKRAPRWIQKIGMEWAYRFAQNPKRLGRFWALPRFALAVKRQAKVSERWKAEKKR